MESVYDIIVSLSAGVVVVAAGIIIAIKCRRQPTQVRDWVSNPASV